MVDEEEGIVGREFQRGHAVTAGASDPRVDGVVNDLKLHLEIAVVSLLEGQHDLAVEERLVALLRVSEELGSGRSAGGLVNRFNNAVVERVVLLLRHQSRKFREGLRPVPVGDSHQGSHLAHHHLQGSDVEAMPLREAGHAVVAAGDGLAVELAFTGVSVPGGEVLVGDGGVALLHVVKSIAQALRLCLGQRVDVLANSHTRHSVLMVNVSICTTSVTHINQPITTPEPLTYGQRQHLHNQRDTHQSADHNI